MKTSILVLALSLLLACATGKPPAYGPRTCIDDDGKNIGFAPYVPANTTVVTCLPVEAAVFMMCVRDLSIASLTDSRSGETKVTLPSVESEPVKSGGGGVETSTKTDLTVNFEAQLNAARAEAIQKCVEVSRAAVVTTAKVPEKTKAE